MPKGEEALIDDLLRLVNLADKKDKYVDTLSRGMKQRLCLARSLIHEPKLLILDEPASGMDPQARAEMKFILKALKAQGKSILISSPYCPNFLKCATGFAFFHEARQWFPEILMKLWIRWADVLK